MKGRMLVVAAVLALVVPTAVSAKIGGSHSKPTPSKAILVPAGKSTSDLANSSRAAQHDGTCGRASTYEL